MNILTYPHTRNLYPHLSHNDHRRIHQQAPWYVLIEYVLFWWGTNTIFHWCWSHKKHNGFLTINMLVIVMPIYKKWPPPIKSSIQGISSLPFFMTTFIWLSDVPTTTYSPPKVDFHRLLSTLSSQSIPSINGWLISWNVYLYLGWPQVRHHGNWLFH